MGLSELREEVRQEFPDFRIVPKNMSSLMRVIDLLLRVITLGRMRKFMTTFTTTIGNTMYVPSTWRFRPERSKMIILRHERVHMRQRRKYGLWYSVSYLLFPLPAVWAYCRMRYEMEAYEESLWATYDLYGAKVFTSELKERTTDHFTSAEYFWMWPWRKRIERWYDGMVSRILT